MINVLFSTDDNDWADYQDPLREAFEAAGLDVALSRDHGADQTDYIIFTPKGPVADFTPFTRCKAVLGLWAGVENIVTNTTLTQPLARMVDEGLTRGMIEWVVGHTMRHHLDLDRHLRTTDPEWDPVMPPLAADRPVTILGLGALGAACGQALAHLGFPVTGWSRSQKDIADLRCLSGDSGLSEALATAQILVLLLPLTDQTESILNAETLDLLPQGAIVLNPGRGALIDDDALLAALDTGQIGHATLDVFREEPLPVDNPYWHDPKVTVTPHIASTTRPKTAAKVIAENIRRGEAGEPFLHLVDRAAGY